MVRTNRKGGELVRPLSQAEIEAFRSHIQRAIDEDLPQLSRWNSPRWASGVPLVRLASWDTMEKIWQPKRGAR